MTDNQKKSIEQKGFEQLGRLSDRVSQTSTPWMDKLFGRWLAPSAQSDWVVDSEWAQIQQEPIRARKLLFGLLFAIVLLIVWSAFADLDEVTRGEGKVIPSQQLQLIQSMDGGIVEEILVREGDIVEPGDLLLRIDETRFTSSLKESRAQYYALSGEVARLTALTNNTELTFSHELHEEAPEVVRRETQLYHSNLAELNEQIAIHNQQLEQRMQDLREAQSAQKQHSTNLRLAQRELDVTRPLLASGAVSDIDIIRLEREVANSQGELSRAEASILRSQSAIEEARNKIEEVSLSMTNKWRTRLAESASKLNALMAAEAGLVDKVKQTEIRSPVRGTIQRLLINTRGGVVTPGREVMEITPLDDQLVVEARISPKDIAFIRPGQPATIKLTAYDFSIYGGLEAEVVHISSDSLTDEKDNTYYLVRLKTLQKQGEIDLKIIPGMTAQVDILTGKKTVLEYLIKPVLKATSQAMTER